MIIVVLFNPGLSMINFILLKSKERLKVNSDGMVFFLFYFFANPPNESLAQLPQRHA